MGVSLLLTSALSQHLRFGPTVFHVSAPAPAGASSFIAHAGGSIDGCRYTNSRQAVERSLRCGFRFVEIDLSRTRDGVYVGAHDWVHFASISGVDGIPDLTEFRNRVVYGRYGVLTSEDLNALLSEHDEMWLVTGKAKGYSALLRQIPFPQRMLVEVFFHRGWRQARAAGVVYPALNVGTMNIRKIWKMAFLGVDMVTVDLRELVAQRDLFEWLHRQGLTILAYTVDNEDLFRSLYGRCLDMAYIDEPFSSLLEDKTYDTLP